MSSAMMSKKVMWPPFLALNKLYLTKVNMSTKILAEQCQKIEINDFVKKTKPQIKKAILKSCIEAEGYNISLCESKTGFGGTRFWFSCPICKRRVGVLFSQPESKILACRKCLKVDYKAHRFSGMIETKK